MRILGVSRKDWLNYLTGKPKLDEDEFTTFRLCRRDKDWQVGELVQVVYKPRSKDREFMGGAEIISKEPRHLLCNTSCPGIPCVSTAEARQDGFTSLSEMERWLLQAHGNRVVEEPINKLTVKWWLTRKYGQNRGLVNGQTTKTNG